MIRSVCKCLIYILSLLTASFAASVSLSKTATKKDTYGNVGAIAAAKAQARANKRKLAHPPYASFEDSMASSGTSDLCVCLLLWIMLPFFVCWKIVWCKFSLELILTHCCFNGCAWYNAYCVPTHFFYNLFFISTLYLSGNSSSNFHFQPAAQLVFRGADGRVENSTLAAPPVVEQPNALQYQQQQQQQMQQQVMNYGIYWLLWQYERIECSFY